MRADPSAPRNNCFIVQSIQNSTTFQALTNFDLQRWLQVIQNNIANKIAGSDFPLPSPPNCSLIRFCADCGSAGATWASINWGLTLCSSCTGLHRGFSSNVSIIRSLELDDINKSIINFIDAIGSQAANTILEAKVKEEKIIPTSTEEEKKKFH